MTKGKLSVRVFSMALICAAAAISGCASVNSGPVTAAAVASQTAELSTFYKLAQDAGLGATLAGAGPITVFAPSNEAFKAVPAATLDKLAKDPELLKSVLSYHIVSGAVTSDDIKENTSLQTISGVKLGVSKAGDFVTVDDGMVSQANIKTSNGVVHVIDRVLTPPKK